MNARHARQERLREIGADGQARIAASTVVVSSRGRAAAIEARYLAGAGFGRVVVPDRASEVAARAVDPAVAVELRGGGAAPPDERSLPGGVEVDDGAARAIAEGAYRALVAIRHAIGRARG